MPEYSQIQTYVKCNKDIFDSKITQFIRVLSELGFEKEYLLKSFKGLEWEESENGFAYCGYNINTETINLFGRLLKTRPLILGWTPKVICQISEPWLEITLLFETEEIEDPKYKIKDEVKLPLWNTMLILSKYFRETGIYLTDEVTDGKPWEALLGLNNDIWSFDAAIIPVSLAKHYRAKDRNYFGKTDFENIYLINKITWGETPW